MQEIYDKEYYKHSCGSLPYESHNHWLQFFGSIADRIVHDINPVTVLDAGCAMGYLVAALRDRGVQAFGIDISIYAISQVRDDIKQYCTVSSLLDPIPDTFPGKYDLVVSIEVLEHLFADDGVKAIRNLCALSDKFLFSSTPDDISEITHVNVNPQEYWARAFADNNYYIDYEYVPNYISPQAVFYKRGSDFPSVVFKYEHCLRFLRLQISNATQKLDEYKTIQQKDMQRKSAKIYMDFGDGFTEDTAFYVHNAAQDQRDGHFLYEVKIASKVNKVRFDPIEGSASLVYDIQFQTETGKELTALSNGNKLDDWDIFDSEDPQFEISDLDDTCTNIRITGVIVVLNNPDYRKLIHDCFIQKRSSSIISALEMIYRTNDEKALQYLNSENDLFDGIEDEDNRVIKAFYRNYLQLKTNCIDLDNQRQTIIEKSNYYKDNSEYLNKKNEELLSQLTEAQNNYQSISQARFWKMTKPLRVCSSFIKQVIRSNRFTLKIARGIKYFRRNGLIKTLNRLNLRRTIKSAEYSLSISYTRPDSELKKEREEKFIPSYKFSILVPLFNTKETLLVEMIESVIHQTYSNWELCLADGSDSAYEYIENICKRYTNKDSRIKYKKLTKNLGISNNTNACAQMAEGDYIALFDHDDFLHPSALYENMKAIQSTDADVLYSDEDHISESGKHISPFYKPNWSPDLLYSQMYICHFLVIRAAIFRYIGGFRCDFDGSQDYDLMLRLSEQTDNICHIPQILYSWRETETSTAINPNSKPYAHTSGLKALDTHLKSRYGKNAHAENSEYTFVYEARFNLLDEEPLVSIIIPMKDNWELSDACIASILEKSTYQHYEILILNNRSEKDDTITWLREMQLKDKRICVIDADMEFNWSKLNNFGIRHSKGEVFIFLNNDIVVISPDWIEKLAENALRDDIGVVGAQLLFADNTIQHAGVVVGIGGWAGHIFSGLDPVHNGFSYVSPMISRNVLAVTGACMAVSKKLIDTIGAFDENFIICGSDVELCIRAYENGYNNLYNARVKLYHFESKSRDSYIPPEDFKMSYTCYQPYRENGDPYFNINLDINSLIPIRKESEMNRDAFRNYIKRTKVIAPLYRQIRNAINPSRRITDIYRIPEVQAIIPRKSKINYERIRLNLLVPSLDKKHVYGGIATALDFFNTLESTMKVDTRIIVMDSSVDLNSCVTMDRYILTDCMEDQNYPRQITEYSNRSKKSLPIRKNDVFVATGWWTAYVIADVIEWQSQIFQIGLQDLIYIIQDFEPGFYPWSSRYLMADSTYKLNIPTIAVFNSKLLKEYFDTNDYLFKESYYFDPVLNRTLKEYLLAHQNTIERKKQLLIYGRPTTQRNAFELIVTALKKWVELYPDSKEWNILSAGEMHADVDLGNGNKLHSVGKLDLQQYGRLMLESYIGLSLMVSPHPSYPPLEMSTFGVKTITNCFGPKDLSKFNSNVISLQICSEESIANEIIKLCNKYETQSTEAGNICLSDAYINGNDQIFLDISQKINQIYQL